MLSRLVKGGYTEWTNWGACSQTCGTGAQSRNRYCTSPFPRNGGQTCIQQGLGAATEIQNCNTNTCPGECKIF